MQIKVQLSIGYANANHEDVLEIPDSELEDMNEEERDNCLQDYAEEWADNYISVWYEEIEEG